MIKNYIVFRDYETAEMNPNSAQITELAAVIIDPRSLEVIPESVFCSKVCPEWDDDKATKAGWLPVNYKSLEVCGFTKADLEYAPQAKFVWGEYLNYLNRYGLKGKAGNNWNAPIVAGFNSSNFDDIIDLNMCSKFGPKLGARGDWPFYHPTIKFDLMQLMHIVLNNIQLNARNSMSMDTIREYFGMDNDLSHRASFDVLQGAELFIKVLKLFRALTEGTVELTKGKKLVFKNCFEKENAKIRKLLQV